MKPINVCKTQQHYFVISVSKLDKPRLNRIFVRLFRLSKTKEYLYLFIYTVMLMQRSCHRYTLPIIFFVNYTPDTEVVCRMCGTSCMDGDVT